MTIPITATELGKFVEDKNAAIAYMRATKKTRSARMHRDLSRKHNSEKDQLTGGLAGEGIREHAKFEKQILWATKNDRLRNYVLLRNKAISERNQKIESLNYDKSGGRLGSLWLSWYIILAALFITRTIEILNK